VARKTLREFFRNRRNMFLTLGLPMLFVLIFGFAFGGGSSEETYKVAVVDHDRGATLASFELGNGTQPAPAATAGVRAGLAAAFGDDARFGANLTGILANLTYADGKPLLEVVRAADEDAGAGLVRSRDAVAMIVLPENFSQSLGAMAFQAQGARLGLVLLAPDPAPNATIRLVGDPSYASFTVAGGIVQGVVHDYAQRLAPATGPSVGTTTESILSSRLEPFDFIVPGLMVYSMLNIAPQCAAILTQEMEKGTLERIKITRVRTAELLGGVSLAQLVIAAMEVLLMFAVARLMGYHNVGSLPAGILIVLLTALCVVGVGLVIASFATKSQEAANYGILFSVPAGFLSGSFFPIPAVPLLKVGGYVVQPYDILPPTHANRALRDVLLYGKGLGEEAVPLTMLVVLSALFFLVGAWLYRRRRLTVTR
jgi:ABC-2 type transport system permease protein